MAKTEKWKTRLDPKHIFCFMENKVVRTDLEGGNPKTLRVSRTGILNFSGLGSVATVADVKTRFDNMSGWERVV